jgi:putative oxidoreductase
MDVVDRTGAPGTAAAVTAPIPWRAPVRRIALHDGPAPVRHRAVSTATTRVEALRPVLLATTRVVIGFLFACHGVKTVFGLLGAHSAAALGAWPSWWAGLIQLVCGSLLALGLATRAASVLASGSMAFAYFTVHAGDGVLPITNGGEQAALYCWILLLFAVTGPGRYSLDALVGGRRGG